MVQCSCLTLKGARCKNTAVHLSVNCHVHQNCVAKAEKAKPPKKALLAKKAPPKKKVPPKKALLTKKAPPKKKDSPPKKKESPQSKKIPDVYDFITLETVSAKEYLKQSKQNIIVVVGDASGGGSVSLGLDKGVLMENIIMNGDYFYECKVARQLRVGRDDIIGPALVILRGQGNYFILLTSLEKMLKSKEKVYSLVPVKKIPRITHADSVDTGDMLNWKNMPIAVASSWHCQDGTESMLYDIVKW
jgi:hypothetical protein